MSFLTIPEQEGLFTSDDDDDTQDVHLIPRRSPIPRKRGQSIYDEDAEYLRIRFGCVQPARRVSFADTTGGDLVDVKEFVAFDSDEDDESYEAEEAKYRRPERHPIYLVRPEFDMPTPSTLTHAVHTNKIEVEMVSTVEDDPLAFRGIIRVLNISFNKAVYIRSTMDSWGTYYDYPAEYVQGSHDGETDKFSFRLSFAPPYLTHGSRIEFVVHFETPDGDYWANNTGRNYVVTLLLSYEEELAQDRYDMQDIKGILKPGKIYSMDEDFYDDPDLKEGLPECSVTSYVRPICPVIIHPEIDMEMVYDTASSPLLHNPDLPSADGTLSSAAVSLGEQSPDVSSTATTPTTKDPLEASQENQPIQLSEPEPKLKLDNESDNQNLDPTMTDTELTLTATDLIHSVTNLNIDLPHTNLDDTVTDLKDTVCDPLHTVLLNIDPSDIVTDVSDTVTDIHEYVTDPTDAITARTDAITAPSDTVMNFSDAITAPSDTLMNFSEAVRDRIDTVTDPSDTDTGTDRTHTFTPAPHVEIQANVPLLNDKINESNLLTIPGQEMEGGSEMKKVEHLRLKEEKWSVSRTQKLPTINLSEQSSDPDHGELGTESDIETGVSPESSTTSPEEADQLMWLEGGLQRKYGNLVLRAECWSHSQQASGEYTPGVEVSSCMWLPPVDSTHSAPNVTCQTPVEDGHTTALSPGCTNNHSMSEGFTETRPSMPQYPQKATQDPHNISLCEAAEKEESYPFFSVTVGDQSSDLSEKHKPQIPKSEPTMERIVISSVIFLSVVICMTLVLHHPSVFLVMGLFFITLCF